MTVAELIELLTALPPETEVVVLGDYGDPDRSYGMATSLTFSKDRTRVAVDG